MRALPLLLVALAVTSCSSGGEDAPADPKPAYVEAAGEICAQADEDVAALVAPTDPAQFAPYVQSSVDVAARAQTDLAALTPPPDDRAELEKRVLEPFGQLVADGRAFSEQVEQAGTDQVRLLALLGEQPTAESIDLEYLREYGLDRCADALDALG